MEFSIEAVREGELVLEGELALDSAQTFRDEVAAHLAPGRRVTLDLGALRFIDSSGIRELLIAANALGPDGLLVLRAPSDRVARVLRLAGIDRAPGFEVVDRLVDLRETLAEMPAESREGLLRVITAHPSFRSRVIRRLREMPEVEKQEWADILVILEGDPAARDVVVSLLESVREGP